MGEGWVERYSGCAFLHAYLIHSHMLLMVSSSRVTRSLGLRGGSHDGERILYFGVIAQPLHFVIDTVRPTRIFNKRTC